jgi:hypothetical protein
MHAFAAFVVNSQGSGNSTPNITTLGDITTFEAKILHQLVEYARDILGGKVLIQRRAR